MQRLIGYQELEAVPDAHLLALNPAAHVVMGTAQNAGQSVARALHVKALLPNCNVILRLWPDDDQSAKLSAWQWIDAYFPVWKPGITLFCDNEPGTSNLEQRADFYAEIIDFLSPRGVPIAYGAFATGNIQPDEYVQLLPAFRAAARYPAVTNVWSPHGYFDPNDPGAYEWHITRHQRYGNQVCDTAGVPRPRKVITEIGVAVNYDPKAGYKVSGLSGRQYARRLIDFELEDPSCVFAWGAGYGWFAFNVANDPEFQDEILKQPLVEVYPVTDKPIIDLSHWQGVIDWAALAPQTEGVVLRASMGISGVDSTLEHNTEGARVKDVLRGFYHLLKVEYPGDVQALHFLNTVGSQLGYALAVDVETDGLTAEQVLDFVRTVDRLFGKKCMIYTRASFFDRFDPQHDAEFATYPLWVAHHGVESPTLPRAWRSAARYRLWQYSDEGRLAGIEGNVDFNRAYVAPTLPAIEIPPAEQLQNPVTMRVTSANGLNRRAAPNGILMPPAHVYNEAVTAFPLSTTPLIGGYHWVFHHNDNGLPAWSAREYLSVVVAGEPLLVDLPVPFVSQLGTDADRFRNDCGIASLLSMARFALVERGLLLPTLPTVDNLAPYTPLPVNDPLKIGLTFADLIALARRLGFAAQYTQPLTEAALVAYLDARRPVMVLVDYSVYAGGDAIPHLCVVRGYGASSFDTNDPYLKGEHYRISREQLVRSMRDVPGNVLDFQGLVLA